MAIQDSDAFLLNWRFDPVSQARWDETFGCVVYDHTAAKWRMYVHAAANTGTGTVVQYESANWAGPWSGRATSLGHGGAGTWDEKDTGVPYVWCERGATRPWRMLYRGIPTSGDTGGIGLATSLDGITWERRDCDGNALSGAVVGHGVVGQWDASDIDFGSIIKVSGVYYLYYNTIAPTARKLGLATSTDLVTWTKHASNPLFSGVTDYDDKDHDGTIDLAQGFFCPDIVRWDRNDGSARYVLTVVHYTGSHTLPSFDVYTSATPMFDKGSRTYVGKAFETNVTPKHTIEGADVDGSGCDTPTIITDDISRNVVTSTLTGDNVVMFAAIYTTSNNWNQSFLLHHKTMHGATLSDVSADLPITAPVHKLATTGPDANTIGLWLPGQTLTLRDLSTTGNINLTGKHSGIDTNGVNLVASGSEYIMATPGTGRNFAKLNAITEDFTIELAFTFASHYTSSYRALLLYGNGPTNRQLYVNISAAAGPTYTAWFYARTGGSSISHSQLLGAVTLNTLVRLTICRTGGKIYWFRDGVITTPGGSAFVGTLDVQATSFLLLGSAYHGNYWDGYIKECRISDSARWTTSYTPAQLTYQYKTSGTIFGRVNDFGVAGAGGLSLTTTTPANTSITQKGRNASSGTDQSVTDGDFTALTTTAPATRYQQFELALATSDVTATPTVERMVGYQHELLEQREVKHNVDRGDGLKGRHRSINRL